MRILFIGYSNVLKRRMLPFLHEIKCLDAVDIAKYDTQRDENVEHFNLNGEIFNSYEDAILKSKADIAYISTVNSAHSLWAEKALKRGMHVIIDKPAFLSFEKTLEMVELAEQLDLGIGEATVYSFHPQIYKVTEMIQNRNLFPKNLTVNFSFPPMKSDNFRYKKELGGGALNDLGPYAVSVGRIFFNEIPEKVFCCINNADYQNEVETGFSVLAQYSNERSMIGNFGFNSEYINRLNILGVNFLFEINRVFTPPGDLENEVILNMDNSTMILKSERSNCFINFISEFIASINNHKYSMFSSNLINDAKASEMLKMNIINYNHANKSLGLFTGI